MNTADTTGSMVRCTASIHPSLITCRSDHMIACRNPQGSGSSCVVAGKVNMVADREGTIHQIIASEGVGRANSASNPWVNTGANPEVSGRSATMIIYLAGITHTIFHQALAFYTSLHHHETCKG